MKTVWVLAGLAVWVVLGAAAGWALSVWWEAVGERVGPVGERRLQRGGSRR
jgi:hypothetical protein